MVYSAHMSTDNVSEIINLLKQQLATSNKKNDELLLMVEKLQQQVDTLLRVLYGKKSEKKTQQPLSATEETVSSEAVSTPSPIQPPSSLSSEPSSNTPKKPKRNPLPEHLLRDKIELTLPEEQRLCDACGQCQSSFDTLITEQLEFIPARLYVKQFVRHKYACRCGGSGVTTAPLPLQPIDKGIAGPGLLADILISKFQDAMPLYRQILRFKRHHIDIAESTVGDWVTQCATWLAPIVALMQETQQRALALFSDDTVVPVLAKGKTKKGRLWVYISDGHSGAPACTVYDYTPTRNQQGPLQFLTSFTGYLHADAYAGYDVLYEQKNITEVACWAHCRRKFFEITQALKGAPTDADKALQFIGKLYHIEACAKHLSHEKRQHYRRQYSKLILNQFRRWLHRKKKNYLPKTPMAQAIQYALNHWRALNIYCSKGYLSIDNNRSERAIKPIVIGRKNWMFAGSDEGAKRAAIIYSIIETCKQNHVNIFDYLRDVLSRLPTHKNNLLHQLLPYHWKPLQE